MSAGALSSAPEITSVQNGPTARFPAEELAKLTTGEPPEHLVFTTTGGTVFRRPNWRRRTFIFTRNRASLSPPAF